MILYKLAAMLLIFFGAALFALFFVMGIAGWLIDQRLSKHTRTTASPRRL
jgi:hypothetical protein